MSTKTEARKPINVIDIHGIARALRRDPDVTDLSDANRILDHLKPTDPQHDERHLIDAWVTFDPNGDNCEERAAIITPPPYGLWRIEDLDA